MQKSWGCHPKIMDLNNKKMHTYLVKLLRTKDNNPPLEKRTKPKMLLTFIHKWFTHKVHHLPFLQILCFVPVDIQKGALRSTATVTVVHVILWFKKLAFAVLQPILLSVPFATLKWHFWEVAFVSSTSAKSTSGHRCLVSHCQY